MKNLLSQFKMVLSDLTKEDKKLIIMAFIALLCLLFSGCEVQAVEILKNYPPSSETKIYNLEDLSNIVNEIYNLDIDLSTFTNASTMNNYLNNNYAIYITTYMNKNDNSIKYPYIWFANTSNKVYFEYDYSSRGHTIIPYNYINYAAIIDIDNNTITNNRGLYDRDNIPYWTEKGYLMRYENQFKVALETFYSEEYLKYVFYEFFEWYSGPFWASKPPTSTSSSGGTVLNTLINEQFHRKEEYKLHDTYYFSGDITLLEDSVEIKGLETNITDNLYISLCRLPVLVNELGEYVVGSNLEFENISTVNISESTQNWQFSNNFNSGDYVYFVGLGTEITPYFITSEYFSDGNTLSSFMSNNSFRCRYYVEDLPEFFIPTESSGSGDVEIIPPSGDDTEIVGGIKGILQAVLNLPKMILDGLVGLFVPDSEYFYNEDLENPGLWQRFSVFMQGKLGFLWDVLIFIPNLISTIIDVISSFSETWSITIPDLKVPSMTGVEEVVFLKSFKWSPYDWINQKVEFRNLYELYLDIIDFFVYWGLIWFFVDTVMTVFGNSDTVIDTTYNE